MPIIKGLAKVGLRGTRAVGRGAKRAGLAAGAAAATIPTTILANSPELQLIAGAIGGSLGLVKGGLSGLKNIGSGIASDFRGDGKKSPAVMWLKDIAEKMSKLLDVGRTRLKAFTQARKQGKKSAESEKARQLELGLEGSETKPGFLQRTFKSLMPLLGLIKSVMNWGKLLKIALLGGLLLLLPTIYQFLKDLSWEKIKKWFETVKKYLDEHVIPVMKKTWNLIIWPVLKWLGHGLKDFFLDFIKYLEGEKGLGALLADNILILGVIALAVLSLNGSLALFALWMAKIVGTKVVGTIAVGAAAGGFWGAAYVAGAIALKVALLGLGLWATYKAIEKSNETMKKTGDSGKALQAATNEWVSEFFGKMIDLPKKLLEQIFTMPEAFTKWSATDAFKKQDRVAAKMKLSRQELWNAAEAKHSAAIRKHLERKGLEIARSQQAEDIANAEKRERIKETHERTKARAAERAEVRINALRNAMFPGRGRAAAQAKMFKQQENMEFGPGEEETDAATVYRKMGGRWWGRYRGSDVKGNEFWMIFRRDGLKKLISDARRSRGPDFPKISHTIPPNFVPGANQKGASMANASAELGAPGGGTKVVFVHAPTTTLPAVPATAVTMVSSAPVLRPEARTARRGGSVNAYA